MNLLGIGPFELVLIMVVAMLVLGPEKLPEVVGQIGKAIRDFRRMSSEVTGEFTDAFNLEKKPEQNSAEADHPGEVVIQTPEHALSEEAPVSIAEELSPVVPEENADLAAGRHSFKDCTFERAPRGLSVRGEASVELTQVRLSGHGLAACVAGKAAMTAGSCGWTGNKTGLWVQENGVVQLSACRFASHAEPALRLGQGAKARLSGCLFHGDWMAVFSEDDSSLEAERTLFRRTPTGVKLEGRSRARLSGCRFSGCALDGLWVAPAADARAEKCVFARCRVGLHSHVAAKPEWPGSTFRLNTGDDRRTFGAS